MRTGPLVDALIEYLVGDLGRYAMENGFHIVLESAVLARAHPRASGGLQLGDRRGGLAHRARDDGDGTTEREVRRFHDEAGSPTP
ncbi:hypothetical protein [Streptomyces sp. LN549]|uniref:hypothetical protein n=1 Tax=Streptomyces sp. LN549 TaxID=3112979 RepID=UPI003713B3F3